MIYYVSMNELIKYNIIIIIWIFNCISNFILVFIYIILIISLYNNIISLYNIVFIYLVYLEHTLYRIYSLQKDFFSQLTILIFINSLVDLNNKRLIG